MYMPRSLADVTRSIVVSNVYYFVNLKCWLTLLPPQKNHERTAYKDVDGFCTRSGNPSCFILNADFEPEPKARRQTAERNQATCAK